MMDTPDPRQDIRRLLTDMLSIVESSPDSLETRYGELRDQSYTLALQVRTAALPDPMARREAFIQEVFDPVGFARANR